jgi:large subunit ribosomal protein L4
MASKLTLDVLDKSGKQVETIKIDEKVWTQEIDEDLLHKIVVMSLANRRAGTASTKTRDEVRGGSRKPWRQKGTGRARAGSIRSPLWRGGGVVFGPRPRSFSYSLPKKMRIKALTQALISKMNEKNLIVISDLNLETHKTKEVVRLLKNLKAVEDKSILVAKSLDEILKRAAHNLSNLELANAKDLNAYDILKNARVILTKEAFLEIERRVKL